MKNAVLIFLMILLPWQSVIAAEHDLTHVPGGGRSLAVVVQHIAEHAGQVLHHLDNDKAGADVIHVDRSKKSLKHLADHEHGSSACLLLPAAAGAPHAPIGDRTVRLRRAEPFSNRTISPLLRPPRLLA